MIFAYERLKNATKNCIDQNFCLGFEHTEIGVPPPKRKNFKALYSFTKDYFF